MKACDLIPHPSTVPANAKANISQHQAACVQDRDLGTWLSRYLVRGRMKQMEKVKEKSPWTEVLEVNTRFLNSAMKWGRVLGWRGKSRVHRRLKTSVSDVEKTPQSEVFILKCNSHTEKE